MSSGRTDASPLTARQWAFAAVAWVVLVAVLLAAADGQTPVIGTAAAVGVVFLAANARALARHQPAPLIGGASARAETLLGAALVTLAAASALDHSALFFGFLIVALTSAAWVVVSTTKSTARE